METENSDLANTSTKRKLFLGETSSTTKRAKSDEMNDDPEIIEDHATINNLSANTVNGIKLTALNFPVTSENVNNFASVMRRCPELQRLAVDIGISQWHESIALFFESIATSSAKNLLGLKLRSANGVTAFDDSDFFVSGLVKLIRDLGRRYRLLELSLLGCGFGRVNCSAVPLAISNNLIHLTALEMEVVNVGGITGDGRSDASLLMGMVKKLTQLEKLSFYGFEGLQIIDGGLVAAVADLHKLTSLRLDYPIGKSDTFNCLSALGELKELRILRGTLSTKTMKAWNEFGGRLESLELPRCSVVCDKALIYLIKNSHRLRRLNLEKTAITDIGLKAIPTACLLLSELDVSFCKKITLEGVQAVIDGCPMLKQVKTGVYRRRDNKFRLKTEELKIGEDRNIKIN